MLKFTEKTENVSFLLLKTSKCYSGETYNLKFAIKGIIAETILIEVQAFGKTIHFLNTSIIPHFLNNKYKIEFLCAIVSRSIEKLKFIFIKCIR